MSESEGEKKGDRERKLFKRRGVLTHVGAGVFGWFLGSLLDPLRRTVNEAIMDTRFGRRAKVTFGYGKYSEEEGYQLQVVNYGSETAENIAAYLAFEEKITDAYIQEITTSAPHPGTTIEVLEGGVLKVDIDHLRRGALENYNPIMIEISVDETTKSSLAYRIGDDPDKEMFAAYRYAWTFLGERYYEATEHHIAEI